MMHKESLTQWLAVLAIVGLGLGALASPTTLTVTPYADLVYLLRR